jgi:NH3-dependent NAD+ synthetase
MPPSKRRLLLDLLFSPQSAEEIIAQGFDEQTVRRVLRLVRMAEFKRKQAAPVLKVTSRAFGTGWRMPIVRRE